MVEQRYVMRIEVPASMVSTVFDVLKDTGIVCSTEPVPTKQQRRPHKKHFAMLNGHRIRGQDLVTKLVANGPKSGMTSSEIEPLVIKAGLMPNSTTSCLDRAIRSKQLKRLPDGRYILT